MDLSAGPFHCPTLQPLSLSVFSSHPQTWYLRTEMSCQGLEPPECKPSWMALVICSPTHVCTVCADVDMLGHLLMSRPGQLGLNTSYMLGPWGAEGQEAGQ